MKPQTKTDKPTLRYICIMPNAWGKGDTQAEAIRNARHEFGSKKPGYTVVYQYPAEDEHLTYINDLGDLYYCSGAVKLMDNRKP